MMRSARTELGAASAGDGIGSPSAPFREPVTGLGSGRRLSCLLGQLANTHTIYICLWASSAHRTGTCDRPARRARAGTSVVSRNTQRDTALAPRSHARDAPHHGIDDRAELAHTHLLSPLTAPDARAKLTGASRRPSP